MNMNNNIIQLRWFMLSFIVLGFSPFILAQSITTDLANMSTSDRKKQFIRVGNAETGNLVLLDTKGIVWKYDGYQLLQWNKQGIENSSFIEQLFLRDSLLYVITNDALVVFDQQETKPQLIKKSKNHYFTIIDGTHFFAEEDNLYSIEQKKIKYKKSKGFALRNRLSVVNDQGEFIYYSANSIYWKYPDLFTITYREIDDVNQLLLDRWSGCWILINKKLHRLRLVRSGNDSNTFSFEGNPPKMMKQTDELVFAVYENRKLVQWKENISKLVVDAKDIEIKDYWIDNKSGIWVLDEGNKMHHLFEGEWFSWNKSELSIEDKVLGVSIEKDIVSIIFENAGIYQSRKQARNDDWIWVPHRLNQRLKNLSVRAFAQRVDASRESRKLHLFTENFGVFVISKRGMGIIKEGFPPFGISSVMIKNDNAIILDKGKRWHKFIFGQAERKSFQKIDPKSLPPEIEGDQFLLDDQKIIYSTKEEVVALDINNYSFATYPWNGEMDGAVVRNHIVYQCEKRDCNVISIPSNIIEKVPPKLLEVSLETANDEQFRIFPAKIDTLRLLASDFPVKLLVNASYVSEPKAIEYGWTSSENEGINIDYKYKADVKWKLPNDGIFSNTIKLKIEDTESAKLLIPISVKTPIAKTDNTWAIYLSAFLAGLLALLLFGARLRSKAQKRKIQQLKMEKKTMELEQKALQLQMNPHFIFNALNGVKGMIALGENKKARQYLTKVSGWIRNMLNDARSDKISVNQELSNLRSYLEIEQELQGNKWDFSIAMDEHINSEFLIPPMMIQPFVENAIIHAFNGIPYRGKIDLRFERKGKRIQVEVEDNGIGLKESEKKSHKSVALEVIKDRLNLLNEGTELEGFSLINKAEFVGTGVLVKILLPILD